MLSRAVEDSGTVTSPLVPVEQLRRVHGGALGVPTIAYLPFCFFNLLSPIISLIYGFTGFRIERVEPDRRAARGDSPAAPRRRRPSSLEGGPA